MQIFGLRASIRTKITGVLFTVVLLTFVLMYWFAGYGLKRFAISSKKHCYDLCNQLSENSLQILRRKTLDSLCNSVKDYAFIADLQLYAIAYAVTDTVKDLQYSQNTVFPQKNLCFSLDQTPKNPDKAAVYRFISSGTKKISDHSARTMADACILHLMSLKKASPWIRRISLVRFDGLQIFYPWCKIPESWDAKKTVWYQSAMQNHGQAIWTGSELSDNKDNVIHCSAVWYDKMFQPQGVISVEIAVDSIAQYAVSSASQTTGSPFLINDKGRAVVGNPIEMKELLPKLRNGKSGTHHWKQNGVHLLAAYAPVKYCNWYLVEFQTESDALHEVQQLVEKQKLEYMNANQVYGHYIMQIIPIYVFIAVCLLATVLVISFFLAKQLTRPILTLTRMAEHMGEGHLSSRIHIRTGDELETLANALNKMSDDLTAYIKNLNQAARERQKVESELKAAAEIQKTLLPAALPPHRNMELCAFMKPAKEIGGDVYDYVLLDDDHLFFMVGDVSGKGMPAALFMASARTVMHNCIRNGMSPAATLYMVNQYLSEKNDSCMFITVFCGVYDCLTGELCYVNAGHNKPLILRPGKEAEFMQVAAGFPLGPIALEREFFREQSIVLEPGSALFVYSDGATEALNEKSEILGSERLRQYLSHLHGNAETVVQKSVDFIFSYAGTTPQSDDLTILMIHNTGGHYNEI